MNKWIGKGRLARDPDVRYTPSGKVVARFTLACDKRKPKDSQQQTQGKQPTADFIDCVAWDKLAELVKNYCGKGKELLVEGNVTSQRPSSITSSSAERRTTEAHQRTKARATEAADISATTTLPRFQTTRYLFDVHMKSGRKGTRIRLVSFAFCPAKDYNNHKNIRGGQEAA